MHSYNLIGFQDPAACFVPQIPDPSGMEDWVASIPTLQPKTKERHWCAMCCVRSLLLAERMEVVPSVEELFDRACEHGVYKENAERGWVGAYHQELATFISSMHPNRAMACRAIPMRANEGGHFSLGQWVGFGHYVLLSVHPDIRLRSQESPPSKRGHFVFVYGYEEKDGQGYFRLHNPAGYQSQSSQVGMLVSAERIAQVSSGDGVVILSRSCRQRI